MQVDQCCLSNICVLNYSLIEVFLAFLARNIELLGTIIARVCGGTLFVNVIIVCEV